MKQENENNNKEKIENLEQLENKIVDQGQLDNNINLNNIELNNQEELDKELIQDNDQEMYEQENNQENINYENFQNENDMNNMNMEYNENDNNINENLNIEEDFEQIKQDENDINDMNENVLINQYNNNNFNNVDINELKELSDTNNMNNNINNLNVYNDMEGNIDNNMIGNNMMDNNINNIEGQYYDYNEGEEYNENEEYQNNVNENNDKFNNEMENMEYNEEDFENILNSLNIDELREYAKNLKNEYDLVVNENNQLKMAAGAEMNNNNKYIINLKKQNNFYLEKIKELQMQNKKIGKELIEIKNKFKIQNKNNLKPSANLNNIELIKLDSKIHEYESLISKLNLEKKMLESKIENIQKDYQNEINLLTNYKNNEIQSYKKIINDLKNKEKNNINNLNLNKKIYNNKIEEDSKFYMDKIKILQQNNEKLTDDISYLEEENKNLKYQIDRNNLNSKYKDNIINKLKDEIISFKNDYNGLISSQENDFNQSQMQIQQLLSEKEQLLKENNGMDMSIKLMNEKVKDSLIMYNNEKKQFIKVVQNYKNKNLEYKIKIMTLKKRIDELLLAKNINFSNNANAFVMRKDHSAILNHNNNMNSFIPNKANYSQGKLNFVLSSNNFI